MSKFWIKFVAIVVGIVFVGMLLFIIKLQWDAKDEREALSKQAVEMKQLSDNIVRNQAKYVSKKDLEEFAKQNEIDLDPIKEDLEGLDAEIKGISAILAKSLGYYRTNLPSTTTTPKPHDPNDSSLPTCRDGEPCPDPYGYMSNTQTYRLFEPFPDNVNVPIGSVDFEAWKKAPWTIDVLKRRYHVTSVLGQDEDGRHYIYNKFQIEAGGKRHPVKIQSAEFVEEYPESKFRFSPRLHVGTDVGALVNVPRAEIMPNIQMSLFSYGRTKVAPDWTFVGVGFSYETQQNTLGIVLTPVNYNIGQHIPFVENIHLGPTIGVDIEGKFFVGGGIRVGL